MIPENKVEGRLCVAVNLPSDAFGSWAARTRPMPCWTSWTPGGARGPFFLPNLEGASGEAFAARRRQARHARPWLDEFFVTEFEAGWRLYRVPQHIHDGAGSSGGTGTSGGWPATCSNLLDRYSAVGIQPPARRGRGGARSGGRFCGVREEGRSLRGAVVGARGACAVRVRAHRGRRWARPVEPVLKRLLKQASAPEYDGPLKRSYVQRCCCWPPMPPLSATPRDREHRAEEEAREAVATAGAGVGVCWRRAAATADIVAEYGLSLSTVKSHIGRRLPQAGRAHRHGRRPEGPRAGPAGVRLPRWGSRSGRGALTLSQCKRKRSCISRSAFFGLCVQLRLLASQRFHPGLSCWRRWRG